MPRQSQRPNERNNPANARQANEEQCERDWGTLVALAVHRDQVRRPVDENKKKKQQQRYEVCCCQCGMSCHFRLSFQVDVRNRPRYPVVIGMMGTVGEPSMRTP